MDARRYGISLRVFKRWPTKRTRERRYSISAMQPCIITSKLLQANMYYFVYYINIRITTFSTIF